MMRSTKAVIRTALERSGYWFRHRSVLPFGVDYLWDIERLARTHGVTIRCAFDIGAHEGETAAEFLRTFAIAQVHSFEPHPSAFSVLSKIKSDPFHPHCLA